MYNIAFEAPDKADAKDQLDQRNSEQETPMGTDMATAIKAAIDAMTGSGGVGVGVFGDDATVNLTLRRTA